MITIANAGDTLRGTLAPRRAAARTTDGVGRGQAWSAPYGIASFEDGPDGVWLTVTASLVVRVTRATVLDRFAGEGFPVLAQILKVGWPSGAALRRETPNHPPLHWLATVVASGVGKAGTRSRQVRIGEMSDG